MRILGITIGRRSVNDVLHGFTSMVAELQEISAWHLKESERQANEARELSRKAGDNIHESDRAKAAAEKISAMVSA